MRLVGIANQQRETGLLSVMTVGGGTGVQRVTESEVQ